MDCERESLDGCATVGNNRREDLKRYGTVSKWVRHDGVAKGDWGHLSLQERLAAQES